MKTKCLLITLLLVASVAGAQVPLQPGCSMPLMTPNGKPDYMSGCVGNYANSPLPRVSGSVTALTLLSGGIGYSSSPVVTIDPPGGAGTTAHAVAQVQNGSIVGFTISVAGSGYTFVPGVMIMDATGRDASASAVIPVVPGTGMRKFVDTLPGLCSVSGLNNLQQCIPIATPDTTTFGATNDFYRIGVRDYSRQLHSDLPVTKLRGYVQLDGSNNPVGANQYLGPMILAQRNRPVRVLFKNMLGTGAAGKLFLPVDTTYMGAGMGPDGTAYSQNRAVIHLHGGNTPWISDGTPHQWITPAGESSNYKKGASFNNVPDMIGAGKLIPSPSLSDGLATYYFTNQQSGRLMWYHDHSYGMTRLNVYAGEAAPYLLYDPAQERALATVTLPGAITNSPDFTHLVPLVIQDKTFVPDPTAGGQLNVQDPTWDVANWGGKGNLWFPHLYLPNQNPSDDTGANPMGRWDYGPWFWPPQDPSTFAADGKPYACPTVANPSQICPGTPIPSGVPEGYMDTPVINGTAYAVLHVAPAANRFLVLDSSNDRYLNLSFYQAYDAATNQMCPGIPATPAAGSQAPSTCTEVKLIPPSDGIAGQGPVPDPSTAGPDIVQIGTEGGMPPDDVVIPPSPVSYTYNRRDITVLNVAGHSLFLGPAERADLVVDFSAYSGKTLILYNDAPAPVPAFDGRNDYFTGAPGQTDMGGAPTPQPRYGPNTRTILQVVVDANAPNTVPFDLPTLHAAMPSIFAATQDPMIVPEQAYGAASNVYSRIEDTSLGFGPVSSLSLTNSGAGYATTPTVTIAPPGGSGTTATATATIDGRYVASLLLLNGGSGYTTVPTVSFTGGGGSGAAATATITPISVAGLTLTNGGSGYTSAPTVSFTGGGGSGAIATAKIGTTTLNAITVTNGGSSYTGTPTVTISGGGTGATARATAANRRVSAITITTAGSGYVSAPSVTISGGGGTGATAMSTLKPATVITLTLSNGGSGYTSAPTVKFSGGGGTGALATATLSNSAILSLTLTNKGAGYTSVPAVVFTGGGGTGATATANYVPGFVSSLTLTSGGSGYAATPSVTISGGGGSGATATAATRPTAILAKAIQELFTLDYGRMNATLGVEIPFTNFTTQTTIPYGYVDPSTEIFKDGETQLWKITHNGVDTHAIHFHLFNVQVVNRVGWDGLIKPPDSNELSWKDTVRMNPLEDVIVALRPAKMSVPFPVPNSMRHLDVTMLPDMTSATMFTNVDPTNQPAVVTNALVNFG